MLLILRTKQLAAVAVAVLQLLLPTAIAHCPPQTEKLIIPPHPVLFIIVAAFVLTGFDLVIAKIVS